MVLVIVLFGVGTVLLVPALTLPFSSGPSDMGPLPPAESQRAAPGPLRQFFPIGVWVAPASDFAKWKDRGINTVTEVPQGHDLERWTAEARRHGLRMIRAPRPRPEDDRGEELLLAWLLPDEPDLRDIPAAPLRQLYDHWKSVDPDRPVLVNFSGGHVLNLQGTCRRSCYREHLAAADWVASAIYPVTGWGRADSLHWVGRAVTELSRMSGERPQFAFIETSDQRLSDGHRTTRGVTAAEMRAEIWSAIVAGARGIYYFSSSFNPFEFDTTPPDVVGEMVRQNALITGLAPVLQGVINPPPVGAHVRTPLEVTWRSTDSAHYVIVVNTTSTPFSGQTVSLRGMAARTADVHGEGRSVSVDGDVIRDDFGPHDVHIYVIARSS